jgi:hypothetical protein
MEPMYTRAQVEALQVPVLAMLTLHLPDQPMPLAWLQTNQRPDVAALAQAHQAQGNLTFTAQWVTSAALPFAARCWLVVEVERPPVRFALEFPLPAAFADLVEVVTSRRLALLAERCPTWLVDAARRAEEVEVDRLHPHLAHSLLLPLEADGCLCLAQYLLDWQRAQRESEAHRCSPN